LIDGDQILVYREWPTTAVLPKASKDATELAVGDLTDVADDAVGDQAMSAPSQPPAEKLRDSGLEFGALSLPSVR